MLLMQQNKNEGKRTKDKQGLGAKKDVLSEHVYARCCAGYLFVC